MNHFDLTFLKYLQDHHPLPIDGALQRFGKTLATLKRTMKEINALLPAHLHLHQEHQFIVTRLEFGDYITLLEKIQFNRYLTTPDERVRDLFVALCLNDVVNKSEYYKKFFVSAGTLKNDYPSMQAITEKHGLALQRLARKGTQLTGDEFRLRVAVCMQIIKTVEVDGGDQLIAHKANEPVNRSIALQFLQCCQHEIKIAAKLYQNGIQPRLTLSYNGKKYFLVYMSLALQRIKRGHEIGDTRAAHFITTWPWQLLDNAQENAFIDLLVASLTCIQSPFTLFDAALNQYVKVFIARMSATETARAEIYTFLYAAIIQNRFHLWFDDKKLHQVKSRYPALWQEIRKAVREIETHWQIHFSEVHLATLVLIVKKYALQNRLISEPKKRVIIVTNSSDSKVGYFKESLRSWFHIDILRCVNINEIERLREEPFDLLITFTNKISSYLKYHQQAYVKVNFHLTLADIALLREHGLPRARHKIPLEDFAHQIEGMKGQALRQFLRQQYGDTFV